MKRLVTSLTILSLSTGAAAQPVTSAITSGNEAKQEAAKSLIIPANTEVILRMSDDLTSKGKQSAVGQMFRLTVAYNVSVNGVTAIPAGTPAVGEVTFKTGKAVFGKSGKLEVALRHIDLNGQRIPVTGKYRQEGEGNTVAAVGAVFLAAGLLFVTGKSALIPRGRELTAYTSEPVNIRTQQ